MSIDAGDRWVEYKIKERERVGNYMYEHQYDYVDRSKYEKVEKQLTKATELLRKLVLEVKGYEEINGYDTCEPVQEAEQFLNSEVEK